MERAFIRSGNWLKGSLRLWLFDLGCASFLGVGLFGLVMALALPLLFADDIERELDAIKSKLNNPK